MQTDVYADILFLINFSMDYLCIYITAKVLHKKIGFLRSLIAAAFGGIYSVISLFFYVTPVIAFILDCAVCAVICAIAFACGKKKLTSLCVPTFLYVGISMMTGGCMTAIFNLLNKLELPLDLIGEDSVSTYLFAILAAIAGVISLKSGHVRKIFS